MWYESCTQEGCQKKVIESSDGSWHCGKCDVTMAECETPQGGARGFCAESKRVGESGVLSLGVACLARKPRRSLSLSLSLSDAGRRRYMVSATFTDPSAQCWVSAFNDHGLVMFDSITADQLATYKEETENNEGLFDSYIKETFLWRQYVVKARVKSELWQEQSRVKTSIVDLKKLDFVEESRELINAIKTL